VDAIQFQISFRELRPIVSMRPEINNR